MTEKQKRGPGRPPIHASGAMDKINGRVPLYVKLAMAKEFGSVQEAVNCLLIARYAESENVELGAGHAGRSKLFKAANNAND